MCLQEVASMTIATPRLPLGEFSSSRINKLGNAYTKPTTLATALPSIKSLIDCTSSVSVPVIKIHKPRNKFTESEFNEMTKRLKVRLQFAYFKLRTNQTEVKFRDLQKQKERKSTAAPARPRTTKRRKLLVGHGNLKTPAKSTTHQQALNKVGFAGENGDDLEKSPQNYLKFYNNTTPLGKSSHNHQQHQKQETPMSVKAAKSLIHLFTSSQQ